MVPSTWSDDTCAAFDREAARHHGLPPQVARMQHADMPDWLNGAVCEAAASETVGETAATQVFDRIAGAWTCLGWQLGYFETESDARAFFDELRHLMCRRLILPDRPELAGAGIAWAYGIGSDLEDMFAVDPGSGMIGRAGPACVPQHDAEAGAAQPIAVNDGLLSLVLGDNPGRTRALPLWRRIVTASWQMGHAAVRFAGATAPLAQVLSEEGAVGQFSAAPAGMTIDLAALVCDGRLLIDDLVHVGRLATIASDIALMMRAYGSRRDAAAGWAFRPLGLSAANVAPALMAQGIAYDSAAGRATAAAMFALLGATAHATSAELAGELGACPGFAPNRDAILSAAGRRRRLMSGVTLRNGAPAPQRFDAGACDQALADSARAAWNDAAVAIERDGLRNATLMIDAQLAPLNNLTRFERLPGGGFGRTLEPAAARGLAVLGYDEAATADALVRLAGHGTLADAPAINHDSLRARGFTQAALAAIEDALLSALHIRFAFNRWVLGYDFCVSGLGLKPEALDDGSDMLLALGFEHDDIAAANAYAMGENSLDDAAIAPAHKPVFAGGGAPAHIRMLAAVQPFVCAPLSETVALGTNYTVEECGRLLALAWRLGLSGLTFRRDGAPLAQPELPGLSPERIRPREAMLRSANETMHRSAMDAVRGAASASSADVVVQ